MVRWLHGWMAGWGLCFCHPQILGEAEEGRASIESDKDWTASEAEEDQAAEEDQVGGKADKGWAWGEADEGRAVGENKPGQVAEVRGRVRTFLVPSSFVIPPFLMPLPLLHLQVQDAGLTV